MSDFKARLRLAKHLLRGNAVLYGVHFSQHVELAGKISGAPIETEECFFEEGVSSLEDGHYDLSSGAVRVRKEEA
jgi:hypothetical protein